MKILLAIDESKVSQEALRKVISQFKPDGNSVRVLNVVPPVTGYISADLIPHFVTYLPEVEQDRLRQAKKLVEAAAVKLKKAGFRASSAVEGGDPRSQIVDQASEWHADLIMLGSHGWKGIPRLLLGSVSEAVARHAKCSVEIVRSDNRKARKNPAH